MAARYAAEAPAAGAAGRGSPVATTSRRSAHRRAAGCRPGTRRARGRAAAGTRWTVEETVGLVEVGSAHRQIPGVHLVGHRQRTGRRRDLPGVLVELVHAQLAVAGERRQAHDVARELADHVAAGNPRRQHESLAIRRRIVDGDGDVKQVRAGLRGANRVVQAHCRQPSEEGARSLSEPARDARTGYQPPSQPPSIAVLHSASSRSARRRLARGIRVDRIRLEGRVAEHGRDRIGQAGGAMRARQLRVERRVAKSAAGGAEQARLRDATSTGTAPAARSPPASRRCSPWSVRAAAGAGSRCHRSSRHDRRPMLVEQRRQAFACAGRGVAGHAGVDDLPARLLRDERGKRFIAARNRCRQSTSRRETTPPCRAATAWKRGPDLPQARAQSASSAKSSVAALQTVPPRHRRPASMHVPASFDRNRSGGCCGSSAARAGIARERQQRRHATCAESRPGVRVARRRTGPQ